MKRCRPVDYEVEGITPRGRPMIIWKEVVDIMQTSQNI